MECRFRVCEPDFAHPTRVRLDRNGSVVALRIDGKKITKVGEVEVRGLPEGAVFSPDGRWLYVGNCLDSDISVLRVDGDTLTNTRHAPETARQAGVPDPQFSPE